jgi:hypothetical protein
MENIPVGYFAISRSLQNHWQDLYSLLASSDKLCSTMAKWNIEDIESHVASKNNDEAEAAKRLMADHNLLEIMYSQHGREWLKKKI